MKNEWVKIYQQVEMQRQQAKSDRELCIWAKRTSLATRGSR